MQRGKTTKYKITKPKWVLGAKLLERAQTNFSQLLGAVSKLCSWETCQLRKKAEDRAKVDKKEK